MSAGPFIRTFYETNSGAICRVKIQPETIDLTFGGTGNNAAIGPADQLASAKVSAGKSEIGVITRMAYISMAAPPTGYKADSVIALPILTPATYNAWEPLLNVIGSYLGVAAQLVGLSPERVR